MKKLKNKKILMLGTAVVSLNVVALSQVAHAVTATITLTATTNLHFGRFAPDNVSAGTVVISPAGAQSFTGGIVDAGSAGISQAAGFSITGDPSVDIQITSSATALSGPGPNMNISTIKYSIGPTADTDTTTFQIPTTATTTLTFSVGATLSVANSATQTNGAYTGGITLTANYL